MTKTFFSTISAAKVLGCAPRTVTRIAERIGVEPLVFEYGQHRRLIWLMKHITQLRRYIKVPLPL